MAFTATETEFEEIITDEILVEILRRLSIKCRVHCSPTCKLWRRLLPYADRDGCLHVTALPIKGFRDTSLSLSPKVLEKTLKCVLAQTGNTLKSISIRSWRNWQMSCRHFDLIAEFAPQITSLSLGYISFLRCDFNVQKLSELTKLTSFTLDDFRSNFPAEAAELSFDLAKLIALWPLEHLKLTNLIMAPAIVAPKLLKFELSISYFSDSQLAQLCTGSKNLTRLRLWDICGLKDFFPIAQLASLTSLELSRVPMSSLHLEEICKNCTKIEQLTLNESEFVSHVRWLHYLRNLKLFHFGIPIYDNFINDFPDNLPVADLKILGEDCNEKAVLTNKGMIELSRKTPMLKRFELCYAKRVTSINLAQFWNKLTFLKLRHVRLDGEGWFYIGQSPTLRSVIIENVMLEFDKYNGDTDDLWPLLAGRQQSKLSTPMAITTNQTFSALLTTALESMNVHIGSRY